MRQTAKAAGAVFALAAGLAGAAAWAGAPDVAGLWRTPTHGGLIRIEACGDEVCGRSVDSPALQARPDQTDVKNPDPALRNRPIKGMLILKARRQADGSWGDGWVYNPNDGKTYHLTLKLAAPGRLKVTGCLAALLCASQTWTLAEG
jgi:uncharacterized protein (DUF2147 family)